jgi:hypothetical protein
MLRGLPWVVPVNTTLYERLKDIASDGRTDFYQPVGELVNLDMNVELDRNTLSMLLDEINRCEHARGAPLLSSVVILATKNLPGHGYFTCARNLGVFTGNDELKFWLEELRRVHEYWKAQ